MDTLKFGLWGMLSLNTLLLLLFPIYHYLPDWGAGTTMIFLLAILAFAVNTFFMYLFAVFVMFGGSERIMELHTFVLIPWALLGFVLGPMTAGKMSWYVRYHYANFEYATANKQEIKHTKTLYSFNDAQILSEYALDAKLKHFYRPPKSSQTYFSSVRYRICPLVPKNWEETMPIETFLVFNEKQELIENFDLKYPAQIAFDPEYSSKYEELASMWKKEHKPKVVKEPLFLTMIDYQSTLKEASADLKLFYGLLMGIWIVCVAIAYFPISKMKEEEQ